MSRAPRASLADGDTALLGLLCEGPQHPWQIEKTVRNRDMRFWTDLSQSTIYKQLRALEKAALVTCQQEIRDGRARKVYAITATGRRALRKRLDALLAEPQHVKWRLDLATYNLDLLPGSEALAALKTYRAALVERIDGYRRLERFLVQHECPWHRLAIARRPVQLLRGELRWLDEFIDGLQKRRGKIRSPDERKQ